MSFYLSVNIAVDDINTLDKVIEELANSDIELGPNIIVKVGISNKHEKYIIVSILYNEHNVPVINASSKRSKLDNLVFDIITMVLDADNKINFLSKYDRNKIILKRNSKCLKD